ncbi:MAG: TonB-dependent receptor plug domain-containing protein, partial [Nannocystaceae bacterium]
MQGLPALGVVWLLGLASPAASTGMPPSNPRLPKDPQQGGPQQAVVDPGAEQVTVAQSRQLRPQAETRSRLRGQILVYGSRDPITNARVIADDGTVTEVDLEGRFTLWLTPGEHSFTLRSPGYEDMVIASQFKGGQDLEFEYRMGAAPEGNRYRTVVRQDREIAVSATNLQGDEIHALPGSAGDPFRVVKSLPGAAQLAGFLPYVVVRGAAPGNTGYFLDGVRVPILFHIAVGPSVIHPYMIDSVDFYPGGAPVRLGRHSSGMIEGKTRPGQRDRVRGQFDIRLTDAGGLVEVPLNRRRDRACERRNRGVGRKQKRAACPRGPARGSLTLAGRYSYTGALLTLLQSEAKIAFWDYQLRFDHRLGPRANYTALAYGSFDEIGTKSEPLPLARFEFYRVQQRVRQQLRSEGTADYSLALGFERSGVSEFTGGQWRVAPRIDIRRPLGREGLSLGVGIDQEFQIFRSDVPSDLTDTSFFESVSSILGNRFVSATGAYAELLWSRNRLEVRPGIRTDIYVQVGASSVLPTARSTTHAIGADPRLLLRERLTDRWTLRQNIGLYHQPPSLPIPLPGIESFGFERGLQRNFQGSVGYEFVIADTLRLTQDAYVGRLTNLQDYDLATAIEGQVAEIEDLVIQTTGLSYGLETMLKLEPRLRAYGWAAYTLSRSQRNYSRGGTAASEWDQTHILNIVLGYKLSRKWNLGGRFHV